MPTDVAGSLGLSLAIVLAVAGLHWGLWRRGRRLPLAIARRAAGRHAGAVAPGAHLRWRDDPLPEVQLAAFEESAVRYDLLVWTRHPQRQRQLVSDLNFGIQAALARHRYPRCFLGRDAVAWLKRSEGISRREAVEVGNLMLERGLLHHVLDEHGFEDAGLFYRFIADEVEAEPAGDEPGNETDAG